MLGGGSAIRVPHVWHLKFHLKGYPDALLALREA